MIEEVGTGRLLPVQIRPISPPDLRTLGHGWQFRWRPEVESHEVLKLVAVDDPDSILGLISIQRQEGYIEVKLLESSPQNVGGGKIFKGIAGNLLAYAAKLSFRLGNEGVLMLISKSALVGHYQKAYGFVPLGRGQKMILGPKASIQLIAAFGGEY